MSTDFPDRVLDWFALHGRTHLPWQQAVTPYRVWVSEIMLQQTQVATVIPYFERFIARFPRVQDLAAAPLDEVLHLWSGLGYYSRARNLHTAAQVICEQYGGELPRQLAALQTLPGIGRSTAAAILSLSGGQRETILDGNVKRVLARYFAVDGWPGDTAVLKRLWSLADALTPQRHVAQYNQAMMDLGATLCRRTRPDCGRCPLNEGCAARMADRPEAYPAKRPARALPSKAVRMLLVRDHAGAFLLERRPPAGVWGGLWCLPEIDRATDPLTWCVDVLRLRATLGRTLDVRRHTFSHFHLDIEPVEILLNQPGCGVLEAGARLWYKPGKPANVGLAAPVARLLDEACA